MRTLDIVWWKFEGKEREMLGNVSVAVCPSAEPDARDAMRRLRCQQLATT